MSYGWTVATTDTDEPFDLVAKDPANGEWYTFQVKTVRVRKDRGGEYVVNARKSDGSVYSKSDVDYFIGVLVPDGEDVPRVWMFENRGISEYWAAAERADKRWVSLPIAITNKEELTNG